MNLYQGHQVIGFQTESMLKICHTVCNCGDVLASRNFRSQSLMRDGCCKLSHCAFSSWPCGIFERFLADGAPGDREQQPASLLLSVLQVHPWFSASGTGSTSIVVG